MTGYNLKIKGSIIQTFVALAGLCYMPLVLSQLELVVDQAVEDDPAAIPVQIKEVQYRPGERTVVVRTIHEDIRCASVATDTPSPSAGDFKLILDQVNPDTEPEAVYLIDGSGGNVMIDLSGSLLEIVTTDSGDAQLECSLLRDSFWASGFDDLIKFSSKVEENEDTFTLTVEVINNSKSVVATNVQMDLSSSTPSENGFITSVGEVIDGVWTIPVLWPSGSKLAEAEPVKLELSYPAQHGDITVKADNVTACNRAGDCVDPSTNERVLHVGNPSLVTVVDTGL